jgi:hypothetical protein
MSEGSAVKLDAMAALGAAVAEQVSHPVIPKVRVRRVGEGLEIYWPWCFEDRWVPITMEGVVKALEKRAETIHLMDGDHFNHGFEPPAWDEIDWEICRLRVRNPGKPIQPLICGANGSGKTFYCSSRSMQFCVGSRKDLMWSFALDENNSRAINQKWMHWYLPLEYLTEKGSIRKTATAKLSYSEASGFTDNRFALHSGTTCEYKFYKQDIKTLEGPRPAFVWMDEEFEDAWLEGVERRLLTHAGRTRDLIPMWKKLLAEKAANPSLKFPREKLWMLFIGVQLISFTPKGGYTPVVRAFTKGAEVRRTVEADLLPLKSKSGVVEGYEAMPKLLYSEQANRIVFYLHAWDNPIGGNWEAMREKALTKPRKYILWWCYGVAEATIGVMYPKFSRRAHVRPWEFLPGEGTWYMVADPNDGTRNWTLSWTKVSPLGEKVVAREWPQQDDYIPGEGYAGPWAEPATGKRVDGDPGPAQKSFGRGFKFVMDEIARVERELHWMEERLKEVKAEKDEEKRAELLKGLRPPANLPEDAPRIPVRERFMDSRAGNTETMTHGASITLIELMAREYKLYFSPVDKDHGAVDGSRATVGHGAKMVEDALAYDESLATVDEATGLMTFRGKAPKLYFIGYPPPVDHGTPRGCENHIFAMETWTNKDGGEGACKDFADLPRYLEMMGVRYVKPREAGAGGGFGGY